MMNPSDSSNLFTLNPEVPWAIDESFNTYVDFCIWVLEIDGLRVPPFEQHSEGNRILQDRGLNTDFWRQWFATVVALQDAVLLNYEFCPDQSLCIEQDLNRINTMLVELKQYPEWSNQQIDLPAIRSSLLSQYAVSEQRYQKAVAQVSHLSGNFIDYIEKPFDVFPGSTEIKETLVSLWERYKQICEQERAETPYQRGTSRTTGDTTKICGLEYLKIYKVRYPVPVEYFVPPASIIVALANDLVSNDDFYALVERAARRFVKSDTDT